MALNDFHFRLASRKRLGGTTVGLPRSLLPSPPAWRSPLLLVFTGLLFLSGSPHHLVLGQDCGTPPAVGHSVQTFHNDTVGNLTVASVSYFCKSGFKVGSPGFITVSCNASDIWDVNDESAKLKDCKRSPLDEGCMVLDLANLTQITVTLHTTPSENFAQCVQTCRGLNYFYFARQGPNCFCFDSLLQLNPTELDDAECSEFCHDNKSYCGGYPDKFSVYTTLHSEVHIDDIRDTHTAHTGMFTHVNCQQYCKGKGSSMAFYIEVEAKCFCLDKIPEYTAIFNEDDATNNTGLITMSEASNPLGSTCEVLFSKGIFYHGHYIMSDNRNVSCTFYDNSAPCDIGWYAYQQGCYRFLRAEQNAALHFEDCRDKDSLLVSIGDENEMEFIDIATKAMKRITGDLGYLLGLLDTANLFSYMWPDETQITFRPFDEGYPNNISNACVKKHVTAPLIVNVNCADQIMNAICEKRDSTIGCAKPNVTLPEPALSSDRMVTSMCFETCRSHYKTYSVLSGTDCHCFDDVSQFDPVSWNNCDTPCPTHPFQMCGGSDGSVFITHDVGQPYRETCDQMILEGMLTNVTLMNSAGVSVLDCKERAGVVCPTSWLEIDGGCYRFFPEFNAQAPLTCSSMGGYLSVFESSEEKTSVISTLSNISSLVANPIWAMGLYYLRPFSSRARHTNGAWVAPSLQAYAATATSDCSVFEFPSGAQLPEGGACGKNPFICEKSPDFMGCYNVSESNKNSAVISDYPEMTVRLCLEACKPHGSNFAGLYGSHTCLCIEELAAPSNTKCTDLCAALQSCGSYATDFMSVYRIDYTFNASSCTDLFLQGVLLNGYYTLGDGQHTWCGMKNSTYLANYAKDTAGDPDHTNHRVGEGDVTISLDITPSVNTTVDPRLNCQDVFDPIGTVISVTSFTIQTLITEVLHWSFDPKASVPALVGAVELFGMGTYTWSDGHLFRSWEYNTSSDIYFYNISRSGYLVMDYTGTLRLRDVDPNTNYHGTCLRDNSYTGCYKAINETEVSMLALVKDYQSITVALCWQVCQAQGATHYLISTQSCLCYDSSNPVGSVLDYMEPVFTNQSECNIGCPAHPFQFCGDPPYFRFHEIASRDEAATCTELYDNYVVYNATYSINGTTTQCGLEDNSTSCPPGFIAQNNRCYSFQRTEHLSFQWASNVCFSRSSYLASPTTTDEIESMTNLIGQFTHLRGVELWLVGYYVTFQQGYWTSPLGFMLHHNHSLASNLGQDDLLRCVALNRSSNTLVSVSCDDTLPFICESNSPYLGCAQIDSSNVTSSLELTSTMSLQQCVSFCLGHDDYNLTIAAVHDTTCHCLTSMERISDMHSETCIVTQINCPSQKHQMCGSAPNPDEESYFSVYDITEIPQEFLIHTCDDLFSFGVSLPALYRTKYDGSVEWIRCFKYSPKSSYILTNSPSVVIQTSTPQDGYLATDLTLQVYQFKGWKGQVVSDPFITIDIQEFYVLEGLILIDPSPSTNQQVLHWSVSLDGEHQTAQDPITLESNKTVVWHYLPVPMVMRHVTLFINETDEPRLSLELVGYKYTQHNFHYPYLGCHKPEGMTLNSSVLVSSSIEACRQQCRDGGYPLMTMYWTANCQCLRSDNIRDLYEGAGHCNQTCFGSPCDYEGGENTTKAIFATTDLTCSPVTVNNSVITETVVMNGYLDDVTIATSLAIDCATGYELTALEPSVPSLTTMCHNKRTWEPDVTELSCERLNCSSPPSHAEATIFFNNGTQYGDVAQYSCGLNPGIIFDGLHDNWTVICDADRKWNPDIPACSRRICDSPPTVELATSNAATQTNLLYQDMVVFTCEDGARFTISNLTEANSTCLGDGTWSPVETECTRFRCPGRPPEVPGSESTHNSTHGLYTCLYDYTFSDRSSIHNVFCDTDTEFEWTDTPSDCAPAASRDSPWALFSNSFRLITPPVDSKSVPSITSCALACLTDYRCLKFSYTDNQNFGNCVVSLHSDANITMSRDGVVQNGWSTYYMGLPT